MSLLLTLAEVVPSEWKDIGAFGALVAVVWFVLNWFKSDSKEDRETNTRNLNKVCQTLSDVSQNHVEDHAKDRKATEKLISDYADIIKTDKEFQIKREQQFSEQTRLMAIQKDVLKKLYEGQLKQGQKSKEFAEEAKQGAVCNYPQGGQQ